MSKPDLSEFTSLSARPRTCRVRTVLEELSGGDRENLTAALGERSVTVPAIERWLDRRGFKMSGPTISRHRKGGCSCG